MTRGITARQKVVAQYPKATLLRGAEGKITINLGISAHCYNTGKQRQRFVFDGGIPVECWLHVANALRL